jgi:hypothetical protein
MFETVFSFPECRDEKWKLSVVSLCVQSVSECPEVVWASVMYVCSVMGSQSRFQAVLCSLNRLRTIHKVYSVSRRPRQSRDVKGSGEEDTSVRAVIA